MTDTLEFPTIDDAALARVSAAPTAPKTELATAAAGALDLDKIDLSTLALSKFAPVRKQLADATRTLTGAVHDLSTQAKVDDAKSLRQRLLNSPLADARKISKGLKSKLKSTSEVVGVELEKIEADFAEAAKLITPQIEAREKELAEEKAAREAKEAARRQEFEDKVAGIRNYLALAQGLPSPRIEKGITFLTAMVIGDEWAEFKPIAQKALDETLASLRELLVKTQAAEVEAAERERRRVEAEQRERDLAAERQRLADERAELERERAELSAARAAIERKDEQTKEEPRDADPEKVAPPPAEPAPISTAVEAIHAALAANPELEDKVMADRLITGTGWVRVAADPAAPSGVSVEHVPMADVLASGDDGIARTPDRTGALPLLLAHIAKAFETKFPSQPKPGIEWWAELKRLATEVQS